MPSKKVIAGLLGMIIAVSVVALIPVFMYGFSVNVTEIEATLGLSSSDSPSTSSSITLQQAPSYDLSTFAVEAHPKALSAYEYFFANLGDKFDASDSGNGGTAVVAIEITFDLTTPSGYSLTFSFEPQNLNADSEITLIMMLGPEDYKGEVGTFHLRITISIEVFLPVDLEVPIDVIDLTPVDLTFVVPSE